MRKQQEHFTKENFQSICDLLCNSDHHLKEIVTTYDYPPFWTRPNTFETLVLTILEQQVSLASAYAAYKKLKEKTEQLTPETLILLSDEDLRNCYLSRQKIVYVKELAHAILSGKISLEKFNYADNESVRYELKKLKGIGDWTVDIYLIHALRRMDIFPVGDLALVNSIKMIMGLNAATRDELFLISTPWKPYRSIATMMLWHYYIKKRNIKLLH